MKKTLIKAMVAGTLFASLLSFVGCGSTPKADPTIIVNVDAEFEKNKEALYDYISNN